MAGRGAVLVTRARPRWRATIPPASGRQRTSRRPAASIRAASSGGSGKRRTDAGR